MDTIPNKFVTSRIEMNKSDFRFTFITVKGHLHFSCAKFLTFLSLFYFFIHLFYFRWKILKRFGF